MRSCISSGKAAGLMVASLDRISSSTNDFFRFAELHRFGQDGPALIPVREQLDTRTAQGCLMLGTIMAVARTELATLN
jgi:DNA invertase Pin-like site-specific DNA recombinase